jgi:hypothetical protein
MALSRSSPPVQAMYGEPEPANCPVTRQPHAGVRLPLSDEQRAELRRRQKDAQQAMQRMPPEDRAAQFATAKRKRMRAR